MTRIIPSFFSRYCKSIHRWSVCVPLALYLIFLSLTLTKLSIPLRSPRIKSAVDQPAESEPNVKENQPYLNENLGSLGKIVEVNNIIPPTKLLSAIFIKADKDGDEMLSVSELSEYINQRTQEHINQAMQENFGLFMDIDKNPRNGVISWSEYHRYFLLRSGVGEDYVEKHNERHKQLDRVIKERISRDRASWSEAARNDPDFLTLDEFLAFRHPESSHATILTLVDELLEKLDRDGDDLLTEEEYARLQVGEVGEALLSQGEAERRLEFKTLVDSDGDGKADRKELVMYIDPKNPRHAKEEAETLVALSDTDHDAHLSLSEVLNKMDLFLTSKMVDTARSFHDEF